MKQEDYPWTHDTLKGVKYFLQYYKQQYYGFINTIASL